MRVPALILPILLCALLAPATWAQDAQGDLTAESVALTATTNAFGQNVLSADGVLFNGGDTAYLDVFITARAFDSRGNAVAEGYGVLVDACGAGLLPDYTMVAGHAQPFSAPLEFFTDTPNPAARVHRIEVEVQATPTTGAPVEVLADGITRLSDQEVVRVEWLADGGLRYAIGCPRDLFTDWQWREISATDRDVPIDHPNAALVTDTLRENLELTDPAIFANSRLSFAPEGGRMVYQDGVNRFYTAAQDGTLARLLFTRLNNRVLQNVDWVGGDRFLATYYGAYGEPVIWFAADAEARPISPAPEVNRASAIVPGASPDARRVVLGGTFDTDAGVGLTGYYLNVVTNGFFELLFEASLPGNNYPPPLLVVDPAEDVVAQVYVVRPVEGQPILQCFNRSEGVLHDLAPLPAGLELSERSGLWRSPDGTELALAVNGPAGGLWRIDLAALPACEAQ